MRELALMSSIFGALFTTSISPISTHLGEPSLGGRAPISLWATHYSIVRAKASENGHPLLGIGGEPLGPLLSERDFCRASMEGTIEVTAADGKRRVFDFDGVGSDQQVDCTRYYPRHPAIGRSRFKRSRGIGRGARGVELVPYRTIAVDPSVIPLGSLVYIPAARGTLVRLSKTETYVHDGYFYAMDTGGAIEGNHIDVFLGYATKNPFSFVKSRPSATFEAYLIDGPIIDSTTARNEGTRPPSVWARDEGQESKT